MNELAKLKHIITIIIRIFGDVTIDIAYTSLKLIDILELNDPQQVNNELNNCSNYLLDCTINGLFNRLKLESSLDVRYIANKVVTLKTMKLEDKLKVLADCCREYSRFQNNPCDVYSFQGELL